MDIRKKIGGLIGTIVLLTVLGATGFHLIEGWSWLDSFYTTIVTLGTVGYGDFTPKDDVGKIYVIFLVITGLGVISYTVLELTAFVVEGHLQKLLRVRKVDSQIKKMKGHFIVCGAGNNGRHVVAELIKNKAAFVVVDRDLNRLETHGMSEHPHISGDATDDTVLQRAGIEKAAGLAACLDSDELNLFLALTAKELNPKIRVVAKVVHENSRAKLQRAGADAVVLPTVIGGLRMASELVRPNVVTFLDTMIRSSKGVRFEEATVTKGSHAVGKTIGSLELLKQFGLSPIAIRDGGKDFIYNLVPDYRLKAEDTLVIIAEPDKLAKLRKFLAA